MAADPETRRDDPDDPADTRLERLALERGIVSGAAVEACRAERREARDRGAPSPRLSQQLVRRGLVAPGELARLLREIAGRPEEAPTAQAPGWGKIGKYAILRRVARGGMGEVYEATDPDLGRRVALKVLAEAADEGEQARRFHREARLAARLRHPGIIAVHEVGRIEPAAPGAAPLHYIAMDYVEGRTFAQAFERTDVPGRLAILQEVARAVGHAHAQGVVHRDLKPANILLSEDGRSPPRPIVTDFGLARAEGDCSRLTRSGEVMGTPHYMAPEQVLGQSARIGPPTDVWALGVMLYQALTGRLPFPGSTAPEVYRRIERADPDSPSRWSSRVPPGLERVALQALAKDPGRRYASAAHFAADLERARSGAAVLARRPSRLLRAARRHPGAVAALLVAAVAVPVGVWLSRGSRSAPAGPGASGGIRPPPTSPPPSTAAPDLAPVEREIERYRDALHDAKADLAARQQAARAALDALESQSRAPEHARRALVQEALGTGWYHLGWYEKAERHLVRAVGLDSAAGRVHDHLGRLYLERSFGMEFGYGRFRDSPARARCLGRARDHLTKALAGEALPPADRQLAQACLALARGNPEEARRLAASGRAAFRGPRETAGFWTLAGWATTSGKERSDAFRAAEAARPHHAWVEYVKGGVLQVLQREAQAVQYFDRALAANPWLSFAWSNRAMSREKARDLDGALADLSKAIELAPEDDAYYVNRSRIRAAKGDLLGSADDLGRAVALDADNAWSRHDRGGLRYRRGDFTGALADYDAALRLKPDYFTAWFKRGMAREAKGDRPGALADYDALLAAHPRHVSALIARGRLRLNHQRDARGALADFDAAIAVDDKDAFAYSSRGQVKKHLGDLAGAIADFDRAIALDPAEPQFHAARAAVREKSGDLSGALADFEAALRKASPSSRHRAGYEQDIARLRGRLGGK